MEIEWNEREPKFKNGSRIKDHVRTYDDDGTLVIDRDYGELLFDHGGEYLDDTGYGNGEIYVMEDFNDVVDPDQDKTAWDVMEQAEYAHHEWSAVWQDTITLRIEPGFQLGDDYFTFDKNDHLLSLKDKETLVCYLDNQISTEDFVRWCHDYQRK